MLAPAFSESKWSENCQPCSACPPPPGQCPLSATPFQNIPEHLLQKRQSPWSPVCPAAWLTSCDSPTGVARSIAPWVSSSILRREYEETAWRSFIVDLL